MNFLDIYEPSSRFIVSLLQLVQDEACDASRVATEVETYRTLMELDPRRRGFYQDQIAPLQIAS